MSEITELADELVAARFEAYPFEASLLGLPGPHHRLTDYREHRRQHTRDHMFALARAATDIDPTTLDESDRVTRELIVQQAFALAAEIDVRLEEFSVSDGLSAPALWPLLALPLISLSDDEMAEGFLARLDALPGYLATVSERQRDGVARGLAPPAFLVRAGVEFIDRYLRAQHDDPLRAIRPQRENARFAARRDLLIDTAVRPAYGHYRDFLAYELLPKAREDGQSGLWWQPDGEQRYQALAAVHTTTDHSPGELHQTGLELLEKLTAEYATVGARVFGTRSQAEIFHRLRHDPALRWSSGEELLSSARRAIARAEAAAARWFGRVPSERVVVAPVPAAEAEGGSLAYYTPPSLDGSRPGTYFANTLDVTQRCRHLSEAIAFHEAVPGHHFQITTALGLEKLPLLRRIAEINAYSEGWGLYAERLADEMGLYSDDLARLGLLSQESMRAARLVVDTGLHAYGWSRQRAVAFLTEHTPMPAMEIESEVDRYTAVPAQALSYMVGRLELQRMRSQAEQALGAAFDIREFHDVVLGGGSLPMPILNTVVADWAHRKARAAV
ncbi:DUF885 domain-containing protein [Haloechinothrix halophila]|uniref:DUF885 domain-containing protein n=1 Tax=Haloechinothrix halophila TaxID=1069073 RepID=UPI00040F35FC|nr:DUF885 domain-containing protein [Haloechinothrix halophila]